MATYSGFNNYRLLTVRGPTLTRKFIGMQQCPKVNAMAHQLMKPEEFGAVQASAIQGTTGGALVAVGDRCSADNEPFAEVWAAGSTTSRLVDLRPHWSSIGYSTTLLRPIPLLEGMIDNAFVSTTGQLHVRSGKEIHRFDAATTCRKSGRW